MSHLWMCRRASDEPSGRWIAHELDAGLVRLGATAAVALSCASEPCATDEAPVLVRSHDAQGEELWTLLCSSRSRVRVNGAPLVSGLRALDDRDAISFVASEPHDAKAVWVSAYYSSESRAVVVPFAGDAQGEEMCCMRCKTPLVPGDAAVRCPAPRCRFWHHQSAERPCWTYTDRCAACDHPTALDAVFRWTPEAL